MCSIFGTTINCLEDLKSAGIAGEVRGTDATGVATIDKDGKIDINKAEKTASEFDWDKVDTNTDIFLGHTRATTQGTESNNYNNHPFLAESGRFALCHNGEIYNDKQIASKFDLPETKIKTDTYRAVQLIDKLGANKGITLPVIKEAVEELSGSFALTILTNDSRLILLRHRNPIYLVKNDNDLAYASSQSMMKEFDLSKFDKKPQQIDRHKIIEIDLDTIEQINQLDFQAKNSYRKGSYYSSRNKTKDTPKSGRNINHFRRTYQDDTFKSNIDEYPLVVQSVWEDYFTTLSDPMFDIKVEEMRETFALTDGEVEMLHEIREKKLYNEIDTA